MANSCSCLDHYATGTNNNVLSPEAISLTTLSPYSDCTQLSMLWIHKQAKFICAFITRTRSTSLPPVFSNSKSDDNNNNKCYPYNNHNQPTCIQRSIAQTVRIFIKLHGLSFQNLLFGGIYIYNQYLYIVLTELIIFLPCYQELSRICCFKNTNWMADSFRVTIWHPTWVWMEGWL